MPLKKQKSKSKAGAEFSLNDKHVSQYSNFSDDVWYFDSMPIFAKQPRFNWNFSLPYGERTTNARHQLLLSSFKEVILGMLSEDTGYGRVLSIHSAQSSMPGVRDLFRWMVKNKYQAFDELNSHALSRYEYDLPKILTDRYSFFNIVPDFFEKISRAENFGQGSMAEDDDKVFENSNFDDEIDDGGEAIWDDSSQINDSCSYNQVSGRINIIYYIYWQSERLTRLNFPIMMRAPYGGKKAGVVISRLANFYYNRIPPLPDEVALPLLGAALSWVNERSDDILKLVDIYFSAIDCCQDPVNDLKKFCFSSIDDSGIPWRKPIDFEIRESIHNEVVFNSNPLETFRSVVLNLSGACCILITYFVGVRVNELCTFRGGVQDSGEFPICIETSLTKDSLTRLYFAKGIASKGRKKSAEEKWLIGSAPIDSVFEPPVVRAINVLQRLFSKWRVLSGVDSLVVNFPRSRSMPRDFSRISSATTASVLKVMRLFIFSNVDLSNLPDVSVRGESLLKYRESRGLCIRGHHGRKTFSAYILETRTSLLRAVSQHFKHMNIAITESAYFPAVHRLRQESDSQRVAESIAFFVEVIQGVKLVGRMAEQIEEYFSSKNFATLSEKELYDSVGEVVVTNELQVFFNESGNCFIAANPNGSRCREVSGNASWKGVTPDYMARSTTMCSGCACFAANTAHLPFWIEREARLEAQSRVLGYDPKEFRVDERDRKQAKAMVTLLSRIVDSSTKNEIMKEL